MDPNTPAVFQRPQLAGAIDRISGALLPIVDRVIEFEDIKRSNGRTITAEPVTGFIDDPNPERVFSADNVARSRQESAQKIARLIPAIVIGGFVIIAAVAVAKVVRS